MRSHARLIGAVLSACLLTGCSTDHAPAKYQLPENVQYNYRWTAATGVDLTSDAAIVTRAVIESALIASITQTTTKRDIGKYTYPGYTRAVDPAIGDQDNFLYNAWSVSNLDAWGPVHGTAYAEIVSLQKSSDARAPRSVDALACVWFNGLSISLSSPSIKYRSLFEPALAPQAVKMKLLAPQDETPKLTALGQGPARYPTTDVFGDWSAESIEVNSSWWAARASKPYQDPCAALPVNPVPPEQLATTTVTFYPAHLPTLDPYPGWPADAEHPTGTGK
ncbi:hypothetical protein OHB26_08345 [Nocardia sp. NBC_01503]|uniref:hypothetical protein n=1 Tax=Nocardia sp. NBC_01503 TaxID=2975997 RepID=UPI002E7BE932|nr:hypothetical protein [Nocardia sp. NBC_01503]WTL34200.1 hypothetical protein OHB26_08345 [Nocardia sp. NBC_01503]